MSWQEEYQRKLTTPEKAVKAVPSGDVVYVGTCTSVAYALTNALGERQEELEDVTLTCSQIINPVTALDNRKPGAIKLCSYFMGAQERPFMKTGMLDFTSVHLSQVDIFCRETMPSNVAFLEVSPPDENGYMNYGASGVALHTYIKRSAQKVIVEVNRQVPYVYGTENLIHVSEVAAIVESDIPLFERPSLPFSEEISTISDFLLDQIPDGACIQLGIGGVADAVGYGLKNKNDLGAHTELLTDSMMELMREGVITNARKSFMPGKSVACFSLGTRALYDFIDRNPDVYFMPFPMSNDCRVIAQNDNMISINTAMCVDLFGQVVADNIAGVQFSGTGGQLDFVRGAQMSRGGKSFIAITSSFVSKKSGRNSRIVSRLPLGAAVTTPRSDVQYVVTEYGCVNLKPLTMKQRAHALVGLAHPDYRAQLAEDARQMGLW